MTGENKNPTFPLYTLIRVTAFKMITLHTAPFEDCMAERKKHLKKNKKQFLILRSATEAEALAAEYEKSRENINPGKITDKKAVRW